ncbi:hypothetical protein JOF56_005210 [Kibdelosporangium banguiense]|uniref:eCIS core domain-containing protein n=1 Tax=Kibdelosporangium banguiense TaxID=1365924 RepID=A0ABS4TK94_9PSEU|nr:DUF4157 domain-containing protein [Kibdelosporangium banguiense]MBP2324825.1 hypothetical protein [Kibdelosporangium banguiense]
MHAHDESTEKAKTPPVQPAAPEGIFALQRAIGNEAVAGMVQSVLNSSGRPLDEPVRQDMEARLGADFSDVRLHTGAAAQRSATEIGARAYTSGNHVVIGRGGADPHTLAHELTHVIQQRGGPVSGVDNGSGLRVSDPSDRFEQAAEANAHRAMSGEAPVQRAEPYPRGHPVDETVQRRVGFEFEAQWNVRDVSDLAGATAVQNQQLAARDQRIKVELLRRIVNSRRRNVPTNWLTAGDLAQTADALEQAWLNGDTPTPVGETKLQSLQLISGTGPWNAAVQSLMVDSRVTERPLLGANLSKGSLILRGDRFALTADVSPSGGSQLEWVTDPLESSGQVERVVKAITKMARFLNDRRSREYVRSEDVRTSGGGTSRPNLRIYPLNGEELSFTPQVTGGLRIDTLADLIEFLVQPAPSEGSRAATQMFTEGTTPMIDSIHAARGAIQADPQLTTMDTAGLVGLLALVGSYLRTAASLGDGANPKSIAGGMLARTDFGHNYSLLPREIKEYLHEDAARFIALAMTAAGMTVQDADARVYPNTLERGDVGNRPPVTLPLTRRIWLEGMAEGVDRLKNWDLLRDDQKMGPAQPGMPQQADWSVIHPSLGGLGTLPDTVRKPDGERVAALIVELRRMRGDRLVGDLQPLALAAFQLFEQLGLDKPLRFP